MKLYHRKYGEGGKPLLILHGLFGQSDNWNTLAKKFSEGGYEVYVVDQRNHGLSPHSEEWNYQAMSDDLHELVTDLALTDVYLIGHSMGGKTVMQYALDHPEKIEKMVVADMSPRAYGLHHEDVLEALNAVDFDVVKSRKEAEEILSQYISDFGTKQFLLKNIYWKEDGKLAWRFNLPVITRQIENVGKGTPQGTSPVKTLFLRGGKSRYVTDDDTALIEKIFPDSTIETIEDAGHWLHAEKPQEFYDAVMRFFSGD